MSFKRRFMAAAQENRVESYKSRDGGGVTHQYLNVAFKPKAQAYIDSISDFEKEVF